MIKIRCNHCMAIVKAPQVRSFKSISNIGREWFQCSNCLMFIRIRNDKKYNLSRWCMCVEHARIWEAECVEIFESIKKACDSKSSESIRDGQNSFTNQN